MGRSTDQQPGTSGSTLADRYELRELIGVGAAARVYLARDRQLQRDVAVKMLNADAAADPGFVERFRREAQAIASFSHPNVVTIYDWGTAGDLDYMVMEYVPGGSLSDLLQRRERLSQEDALRLAIGTTRALAAAHAHGIVHRDIKPDNILLTADGEPKVADFGIAWLPGLSHLTLTNVIFGTVSYLSPEQARGDAVDGRSDLYSLGVVLYRMLTGRLPFEGGSTLDVAIQHIQEDPEPPRAIRHEISPAVERIVLKAMAKRPADRFASAALMVEALESARAALRGRVRRDRRASVEPTLIASHGLLRESVRRPPLAPIPRGRGSPAWGRLLWALPVTLLTLVVLGITLAVRPWASAGGHQAASRPHLTSAPAVSPTHRPTGGRAHGPTPGARRATSPAPAVAATAQPTMGPTEAPPAPVAVARPSAVPPAHAEAGSETPQGAVQAFYDDVAHHRFSDARALWSSTLQGTYSPAIYIDRRFSSTSAIWLNGISVQSVNESAGAATVAVQLTETLGSSGSTRTYSGTWELVRQNGRWLLNWPNLRQVSATDAVMPASGSETSGQHGHGASGQDGGGAD